MDGWVDGYMGVSVCGQSGGHPAPDASTYLLHLDIEAIDLLSDLITGPLCLLTVLLQCNLLPQHLSVLLPHRGNCKLQLSLLNGELAITNAEPKPKHIW